MGDSLRIFFVLDGERLVAVPLEKFKRLVLRSDGDAMPEYAGKTVRYAEVHVVVENRRPVSVVKASYGKLLFGADGKRDDADRERQIRLALDSMSRGDPGRTAASRGRRDALYRWTPSAGVKRAIRDAVFGKVVPISASLESL